MKLVSRILIPCFTILVLCAHGSFGQTLTIPTSSAAHIDRKNNIRYGLAGGEPLLLDAYIPRWGGDRRPAVIFIHDGSFRKRSKSIWADQATLIARMGWVAFSIDYRLDVPAGYPAETDDCLQAVRWIRSHAAEFGVDPAKLGVVGGSAGGTMAEMIAVDGTGPLNVGSRVQVAVSWSGPVDMAAMAAHSANLSKTIVRYLACSLTECPKVYTAASPIAYVNSTASPILIINSQNEVIPLSQAQELDKKLTSVGAPHKLIVMPGNRHSMSYNDDAWEPTVKYLEEYLGPPIPEPAKKN